MVQHISRKELKKDEVRDTLAQGAEALLSHQTFAIILVLAALVVAAGVYGWRTYSQAESAGAATGFNNAMVIYQTAVGAAQAPGQSAFTSDSQKFTAAEKAFSKVASDYKRTRSGQMAAYYAALSDEKLNNVAAAQRWLTGLTNSKDPEIVAMAKYELAGIDARSGKTEEAIQLYQQLIAKPSILVPKPEVMLALANCYGAKNPSQAAKVYGQIKSEYPDTPIADQADEALALLPASKS